MVKKLSHIILQGQQRKSGKLLVIPFDYRISKIRISTRQAEMLADHRYTIYYKKAFFI